MSAAGLPRAVGRVETCVRSLASKPDFPAFSKHVQDVLAAIEHDQLSPRELGQLILPDFSLTLNLLRRANARNLSGRQIVSITHAVVMLGMEAVRHLASGQLIFEHFHDKPAGVRELMTLSILSANHVRQLTRPYPEVRSEEAYLCGMVRNLGEVLASYYLPAQYARILKLNDQKGLPLSSACKEVLQFTFEDLGEAVVRHWGLPERVATSVHATVPPKGPLSPRDLLMAAVSLGHLMTTSVYRMDPEEGAERLKASLRMHESWFRLSRDEVDRILAEAITGTQESFAAMNVSIDDLRLEAQTRTILQAMDTADAPADPDVAAEAPAEPEHRLETLSKEVFSLVESRGRCDLNQLIVKVLETVCEGTGAERAIFAFVDPERIFIEGRIGFGQHVDELIEKFKFRVSMRGGPVAMALLCKRSIWFDAARGETSPIADFFGCRSFGLYPIVVSGQAVGSIYMESRRRSLDLGSREEYLLERLRDALTSAFVRVRSGSNS